MKFPPFLHRAAGAFAAALLLASCGMATENRASGVNSYIAGVATSDGTTTAQYSSSNPPTGTGAAPVPSVGSAQIRGGSNLVQLSSGSSFRTVIVAVDGVSGYYTLTLPSTSRSASIVITFSQDPPDDDFVVQYGVGTGSQTTSFAQLPVSLREVGTGDVQVSLSWNVPTDADLHVIDPQGNEIYYGNRSAGSGELDLDSNAGCYIDDVDNENITWPSGSAPHGTYTVRVDYYDSCGQTSTSYVVTVNAHGQPIRTFTGTLTGSGDFGDEGSGHTITTFSY